MKVQMLIELDMEDGLFFNPDDAGEVEWAYDILLQSSLVLHSYHIDACLGPVKVLEVTKDGRRI